MRPDISSPRERIDTLVRHGVVITMDDDGLIIPDGAVAIRDGAIVDVGPDDALDARYDAGTQIDAAGAPVHPGLVEAHLHCSYQLFRGAIPDQLREDDAFAQVESRFYNAVEDDDEHASASIAALEMVRHGTTAFLEPGTVLNPDAAASAVSEVGMRAVLADPFIWDDPEGLAMGKNANPHRNTSTIARATSDIDSVLARLGSQLRRNTPGALVTGHVAALGLGTASLDLLLQAKAMADDAGVVFNMHQSYSPADTARDRSRFGEEPIVALARHGVVDARTTMAHVNHVTAAEFETLRETGASVAWAPAASMMWGHGSTLSGPHAELHRRGGTVALGSDSANWSNRLDLFQQMSLAVLTARESARDRTALVAEDGLWMATRGGARALGLDDRIGSIEAGKRADLVIHTLRRPELHPLIDPIRSLVYSAGSSTVDTVLVDGRPVLRDGRFTTADEGRLIEVAARRSRDLMARMGYASPRDRSHRARA